MNEIEIIQSKIYELRGQRVMLDFDLASLYQVETRVLNQAVKRNIERFPDDFMFQLTAEEWALISSQIVMTSRSKRPKTALPLAFTEHGALMLSSVLRSDVAIEISIKVTRAFIAIRRSLTTMTLSGKVAQLEQGLKAIRDEMEEILADQNDINELTGAQLDAISTALAELQSDKSRLAAKPRRPIGFNVNQLNHEIFCSKTKKYPNRLAVRTFFE